MAARPSTKKQRQLIAIGCSRLGIDADLRHQMLLERFGQDSSTKITSAQAALFIKELGRKGFCITTTAPRMKKAATGARRSGGGNVVRMVTQAELDKIAAVAGLIKWRVKDGLAMWMKKRMGIERVRTAHDAWLAIEGLKKMFENYMKKQHGPDWWLGTYDDPGITAYILEHCPEEYR